jgi:4'-phosphopantetheinyl transferase
VTSARDDVDPDFPSWSGAVRAGTWPRLPDRYRFDGDGVVDCVFVGRGMGEAVGGEAIAGRDAVRTLLSMVSGVPPDAIRLTTDKNGKPVAPDMGIHFNLSHSEGSLLLALCRSAPVGIDLEADRPVGDLADLTAFLHPAEKADIHASPDWNSAFLTCWTRKEAVLKATGQGLTASLSGFRVTGDPCLPGGAGWSLFDCSPQTGWVGAVAVMAPVQPRFWTLYSGGWSPRMESKAYV